MRKFTIDAGNTIVVSTSTERGPKSGAERFTNEKQLAALAEHWPGGRLVEIAGRAESRQVYRPADRCEPYLEGHRTTGAPRWRTRGLRRRQKGQPGQMASPSEQPVVARADTTAARVIALLKHPAGATLKAIVAVTGWQSHSVRGFITAHVRQKMNYRVQSFKRGGERVYRIRL
jgi:hypothetical protein